MASKKVIPIDDLADPDASAETIVVHPEDEPVPRFFPPHAGPPEGVPVGPWPDKKDRLP
jgi:hypothetical protein